MLTPEYILRLSEGAEEIAGELHAEIVRQIVRRIMIRLQRGDGYLLTERDRWQLRTLEDAGFLASDIQKEIAKKTKLQAKEIKAAYEDGGRRTLEYDNAIYAAADLPVEGITQSPYFVRLMQRGFAATMQEWQNYTRTTAHAAQQLFIRECDRAYTLVVSGAVSYTEAVKEAVERVCEGGVYVEYPSGWRDTIETATLRAVRTGVSQSCGQVTAARMAENGITCAVTSSHLGARPSHELWQGEVFWIDWERLAAVWPIDVTGHAEATPEEKAKYRELVSTTELGEITGLLGVNCRHSVMPYIDGVSHNPFEHFDSEENRKRYEQEQRQRALERRIRKTKREAMGLKEAVENADDATRPELEAEYQKKALLLQKQNAAYNRYCEENGLKRLQDRLSVAQWDRSQAASASAAARKAPKQAGGKYVFGSKEWEERENLAKEEYEKIRATEDDVVKISDSSGLPVAEIQQIKNHIFYAKHILYDGDIDRFAPSYDIAVAWKRLVYGHPEERDIILLLHELLESQVEKEYNLPADKAHSIAKEKYPWDDILHKLLGEDGEPNGLL